MGLTSNLCAAQGESPIPGTVRRDSIHTRGVEYGDTVQENTEAS